MGNRRIVYSGGEAQIEEKKSRFLAVIENVDSPEQAMELVARRRKQYWDARHHCWAYLIGNDAQLARSSDDGEPSGTAGHPMLDVLEGEKLTNVLAVVTRYFGGTLLGTGGLVRAYSQAVRSALAQCVVLDKEPGNLIRTETDYSSYGKIRYFLDNHGFPVTNVDYTDQVVISWISPCERTGQALDAVTQAAGGRAKTIGQNDIWFGMDGDGAVLLGDR